MHVFCDKCDIAPLFLEWDLSAWVGFVLSVAAFVWVKRGSCIRMYNVCRMEGGTNCAFMQHKHTLDSKLLMYLFYTLESQYPSTEIWNTIFNCKISAFFPGGGISMNGSRMIW